jgi:mRNA interferase YafQ
MFDINYTSQFKKDFKRHLNNSKDLKIIEESLKLLRNEGSLVHPKFKTHNLIGTYKNHFDSHLKPDLILIWKKSGQTISLIRLCSHSDL